MKNILVATIALFAILALSYGQEDADAVPEPEVANAEEIVAVLDQNEDGPEDLNQNNANSKSGLLQKIMLPFKGRLGQSSNSDDIIIDESDLQEDEMAIDDVDDDEDVEKTVCERITSPRDECPESEDIEEPTSECSAICTSPLNIRDDVTSPSQRHLDDDISSEFDTPQKNVCNSPAFEGNSQLERTVFEDDSPDISERCYSFGFLRQLERIMRIRKTQQAEQSEHREEAAEHETVKVLWTSSAYSFLICGCQRTQSGHGDLTLLMSPELPTTIVAGHLLRVRTSGSSSRTVTLRSGREVLFCGQNDVALVSVEGGTLEVTTSL